MDFLYYIASSYTLLWVDTIEYDRAMDNLSAQCTEVLKSNCYSWDIIQGIKLLNVSKNAKIEEIDNENITPQQPINFICGLKKKHNIIFCKDFHVFLSNASQSIELWRLLLNNINILKENNNVFVIVSPFNKLLPEVERYFTVINFALPTKNELNAILSTFLNLEESQNTDLIQSILNSGLGLTELEFENALALSLAKYGYIEQNIVYEQKKQLLKRNSCLELCNFDKDFSSITGLDVLKDFTKKMALSKNGKGVCLLGIPGTGKSYLAKCLGKETNRITISLDFGKLMGGLVGETERNTNEALKLIDTLSPCILFIDEIEKGLSGMGGANVDSGVSIRQGGRFLTWLNDHSSDVYVVATANNVSNLPSELLRAERWDGIFFVNLPNKNEVNALLEMYKKEYGIESDEQIDLENYTGAEIKSLCRLASSLKVSLSEAKQYVIPVYKTYREKIESLKEWAKDRTINASSEIEDIKSHSSDMKVKDLNDIRKERML
jgi:AAA+ superfamily predicted ATPase